MLSDLPLKDSYRSGEDQLLRDFYIPSLTESTLYQRAVGYFSSASLVVAAQGLSPFLRSGGKMYLVASPHLDADDVDAILRGYEQRAQRVEKALLRSLTDPSSDIDGDRLSVLAQMIERGQLDIKIAVLKNLVAGSVPGLYHEKLGIFHDGRDWVAFTGSPNESAAGLWGNFECVDVFRSWVTGDYSRVCAKRRHFKHLWENQTESLEIVPFPEAVRENLLKHKSRPRKVGTARTMALPSDMVLRPYQVQAVTNWLNNSRRGVLKMATGSGKTLIALSIASHLATEARLDCALILVPYRHLARQWHTEVRKFGADPIVCYNDRREWITSAQQALATPSQGVPTVLIATNATFRSPQFQSLVKYLPEKSLLIGDEVHNLGSVNLSRVLPERIPYRLGLSATPERWMDPEGTQRIFGYFGPIIEPEFTLADALNAKALVPYYYHPIWTNLTPTEMEQYVAISSRISRYGHTFGEEDSIPVPVQLLLFRRARLLGTAAEKLARLIDLMKSRLDTTHALFYCGDGSVDSSNSDVVIRHVDAVCQSLGSELGFRVDSFTAETSLDEREDLRKRLISGELQGLVAIRCLDEGVDIPMVRDAYILASSSNPRQFIQRRGRVLRPFPGKNHASIYDFIVLPPEQAQTGLERAIVYHELGRMLEFASLALNGGEVLGDIAEVRERFDAY